MQYADFLDTVKVLKMLHGRDVALEFFYSNIDKYSHLIDALDRTIEFSKYRDNKNRNKEKDE